jgi:hypothetical protein
VSIPRVFASNPTDCHTNDGGERKPREKHHAHTLDEAAFGVTAKELRGYNDRNNRHL